MSSKSVSEEALHDAFFSKTAEVPDTPLGAIGLGVVALRQIEYGDFSWEGALRMPLSGGRLAQMANTVDFVHTALGLQSNKSGLTRSLPFAHELVRSVLALSFPPGNDVPEEIPPLSDALIERSSRFMADPDHRSFANRVLLAGSRVLKSCHHDVDAYKVNIVAATKERNRGELTSDQWRVAIEGERRVLADIVRPALTMALGPWQQDAPENVSTEKIARQLTRWNPSQEIVDKHFP